MDILVCSEDARPRGRDGRRWYVCALPRLLWAYSYHRTLRLIRYLRGEIGRVDCYACVGFDVGRVQMIGSI